MLDYGTLTIAVGAGTILGAMILIATQIYLDRRTRPSTNKIKPLTNARDHSIIKLWFLGTLKTNQPTIILIFVGLALVISPTFHRGSDQTSYFTVDGEILSDSSSTINAYASATQTTVGNMHKLDILFPDLPDSDYQPHLVLHADCIFLEFPISKANHHLPKIEVQNASCPQNFRGGLPITGPPLTNLNGPRPSGYKGLY